MKKKLHTLSIFLFFCLSLQAQITLDEIKTQIRSTASQNMFTQLRLTNTGNSKVKVKVEREMIKMPSQWYTSLHKSGNPFSSYTSSFVLQLKPNQQLTIGSIFYPQNHGGHGEVIIRATNLNDLSNTIEKNIKVEAVSRNSKVMSTVSLFPNPATTHFKISNNASLKQLVIYNIVGRKLKSFKVGDLKTEYQVGDLARGIYLVRCLNENQKVIETLRLNIIKP